MRKGILMTVVFILKINFMIFEGTGQESVKSKCDDLCVFSNETTAVTGTDTSSAKQAAPSATLTTVANSPATEATAPLSIPEYPSVSINQYCLPSLCEFYNGTHVNVKEHIACKNSGNLSLVCGTQPHLLKMSERRRNLILDLHNLARSRIASGQLKGYKPATHMPQLKWDSELEYLASLHVKRCKFKHDLCHNTLRFPHSGQNIGYFWRNGDITSHSKRMKKFIVSWYTEHKLANQSFIDSFHLHPDKKAIGHFTLIVNDRVHQIGCAVIRFYELNLLKVLMTCNYDYNNILNEAVYRTGSTASMCAYKISDKYPELCDWQKPTYL